MVAICDFLVQVALFLSQRDLEWSIGKLLGWDVGEDGVGGEDWNQFYSREIVIQKNVFTVLKCDRNMSLLSIIWATTCDRNIWFSSSSCVISSFLAQRDLGTVKRKSYSGGMGKIQKKCSYSVKVWPEHVLLLAKWVNNPCSQYTILLFKLRYLLIPVAKR